MTATDSGVERSGRAAIAIGALLTLAAYGSAWLPGGAPSWGVWCMITGTAAMLAGMLALGAARSGMASTKASLAAIALLIIVIAGFGVPLLLAPDLPNAALWLGLPRRVAIEVYGVGLLPVLVFPWLHAMEFRSDGLDEASLAALRAAAEVRRRTDLPR